jgi:GTPase SAR1 family protein
MNEKSINIIKWAGVFLTIWFVGTIMVFILNFKNYNISDSIEHWGQMGDFIGGVLNPCIAVGNIVLLFFISDKVSKIESERHLNNAKLEERRHLNEFRYEAYKEFVSIIDEVSLDRCTYPQEEFEHSIENCLNYYRSQTKKFFINNRFLFEADAKGFATMCENVSNLLEEILKDVNETSNRNFEGAQESFKTSKLQYLYKGFNANRNALKLYIQKVMLNKLEPEMGV